MKALILAAGLGTRLLPITEKCPKCLVSVHGEPVLLRQIACLTENGITDITVVSGYMADVLEKSVHDRFPDVQIIKNMEYASTNNMYSAYLGRTAMQGSDFLMMNADVFFDGVIIRDLLQFPGENAVAVEPGRYLEESMKIVELDGRLTSISKKIPPGDALGVSIDVYKFSRLAGQIFFSKCAEYIHDRQERTLWSEVALNEIFADVPFQACPISGRWVEIDTHEDLAEAEHLFENA